MLTNGNNVALLVPGGSADHQILLSRLGSSLIRSRRAPHLGGDGVRDHVRLEDVGDRRRVRELDVTTSSWPAAQAMDSAVIPNESEAFTSAPSYSAAFTPVQEGAAVVGCLQRCVGAG